MVHIFTTANIWKIKSDFFFFRKEKFEKVLRKKNEEGTRIIVWKVYATLHARNPY